MKFEPLLDTLRLQKLEDKEYFSEKYADYISNSRLKNINPAQGGSKELFLAGMPRIFSDSFLTGTAVHCMCLQPDYFFLSNIDRPTAKVGFIGDECVNICKSKGYELDEEIIREACQIVDYYKGKPNDKQFAKVVEQVVPYVNARMEFEKNLVYEREPIYLSSKQLVTAQACIDAINNNAKMQSLLHPEGLIETPISENEQAILLDVKCYMPEPFIVRLKSKLDNYTIDRETGIITVNDIKTHGKILPEFPNAIMEYRYMREIAMYAWLLKLCAKKYYNIENPTIKGNFLVVSTIPQYYTKVFPMTKKLFMEGFKEFKYLLELAARALYERSKEL